MVFVLSGRYRMCLDRPHVEEPWVSLQGDNAVVCRTDHFATMICESAR